MVVSNEKFNYKYEARCICLRRRVTGQGMAASSMSHEWKTALHSTWLKSTKTSVYNVSPQQRRLPHIGPKSTSTLSAVSAQQAWRPTYWVYSFKKKKVQLTSSPGSSLIYKEETSLCHYIRKSWHSFTLSFRGPSIFCSLFNERGPFSSHSEYCTVVCPH